MSRFQEQARALRDAALRKRKRKKSDGSGPSSVLMKNAYFTPKGGPLAQPGGAVGQMNGPAAAAGVAGGGGLTASVEHNIKAAHGASLGSGAVVREDPRKAADDFKKSLGRGLTKTDRMAWAEYARRQNMTPDDEVAGWNAMESTDVLAALRGVFETTSWWGYSVPNLGMVKMQTSAGPASMRAPDSPAWGPVEAFPFHTEVAGRVWDSAKKMILKHKLAKPVEIISLAMADSKMLSGELTPEDVRLLELAISWAQNGPPVPNARGSGPTADTGVARRTKP